MYIKRNGGRMGKREKGLMNNEKEMWKGVRLGRVRGRGGWCDYIIYTPVSRYHRIHKILVR